MLEYQGWAVIREAFREEAEDETRLAMIVKTIRETIADIGGGNTQIELRFLNGFPRLWVVGAANRKESVWHTVVKLFQTIAGIAPGSYGQLSFRDDEEGEGRANLYRVYVLKKGKLALHVDPFLSPCIPELEE